ARTCAAAAGIISSAPACVSWPRAVPAPPTAAPGTSPDAPPRSTADPGFRVAARLDRAVTGPATAVRHHPESPRQGEVMPFPDRIERTVTLTRAPREVWQALTTPDGPSAWFRD